MTAGSMCSTKLGLLGGREPTHPILRRKATRSTPDDLQSTVWTTLLYYKGREMYKPPVGGAISLLFVRAARRSGCGLWKSCFFDAERCAARLAGFSGMINVFSRVIRRPCESF